MTRQSAQAAQKKAAAATPAADTKAITPAPAETVAPSTGDGAAQETPAQPTPDAAQGTPDANPSPAGQATTPVDPAPPVADPRAEALAQLVAGGGTDDETSGGEVAKDAAPLPTTGTVWEWGGDHACVVLFDQIGHVDGTGARAVYQTAVKGDVVKVTKAAAERGYRLRSLAPLDED